MQGKIYFFHWKRYNKKKEPDLVWFSSSYKKTKNIELYGLKYWIMGDYTSH